MKLLYWIPRIITIIAIVFLMLFSLDCFEGGTQQFVCFIMHNIPAFILTALLVIAWKWEYIGGALLILGAIAGSAFFGIFRGNPGILILMSPFILTGGLFILHNYLKRRNLKKRNK
jgi:hypothetical protein